ncbi:MAG: hypothetical protein IPG07_22150 [Crocinitomicaceae bacterium]|nr:hypothetical protein [Crocinitomicaceae bacterium]
MINAYPPGTFTNNTIQAAAFQSPCTACLMGLTAGKHNHAVLCGIEPICSSVLT